MAGVMTFGLLLTILCIFVSKLPISGDVVHASLQFSKETNIKLKGSVLSEIQEVSSAVRCSVLCLRTTLCRSFNYGRTEKYCQLNRETKSNKPGDIFQDNKYNYYEMENQSIVVDLTQKPVTTKNQIKEEPNSMEQEGEDKSTERYLEPSSRIPTSESPSHVEPTVEQSLSNLTSTKRTTWEPTPEEPTTKEPTTLEQTTKELTTENPTTKEPKTLEPSTEQPTSEEPTTKEPTTLEQTTKELTTENLTTNEPTTLGPATEQPTSEEPTSKEPSTFEPTTEQLTSEKTTLQTTTEELNLSTENLSTLEPSTESGVYHPTCSAIKLSGETHSGSYMIDPDGFGNHPPFQVICNHTSGYGLTHIPHTKSGVWSEVDSNPYDVDIVYSVPMEQIISLIDQSTNCYQNLMAECKNAKLWDSENQLAWWMSRDGVRMPNWGGATMATKGCSCYASNNCAKGNRCNCGVQPDIWVEEGGRLSDIHKLPVSALHFENAAPPNQLLYKLESLQCQTLTVP